MILLRSAPILTSAAALRPGRLGMMIAGSLTPFSFGSAGKPSGALGRTIGARASGLSADWLAFEGVSGGLGSSEGRGSAVAGESVGAAGTGASDVLFALAAASNSLCSRSDLRYA